MTRSEQQAFVVSANYEVFAVCIVLGTLVNSIIVIFSADPDVRAVAWIMNGALSLFLFFDVVRRLVMHRRRLLRWFIGEGGWLILLGSLPLPLIGLLRLLVFWIMVRPLRRIELSDAGVTVRSKRAQSTLLGILLAAILVFELSAIFIVWVEAGNPAANIQNASDALWWGVVTMATVGYGDRYPVTTAGRLIGVATMIVGVALFSAITSFLADWFRRPRRAGDTPEADSAARIPSAESVPETLAAIRRALHERHRADQAMMEELSTRLDELERKLDARQ